MKNISQKTEQVWLGENWEKKGLPLTLFLNFELIHIT